MKSRSTTLAVFLLITAASFLFAPKIVPGLQSSAWGDDDDHRRSLPQNATFTTLITTPRALEGLTGWSSGLAPPYETRSGSRTRTPEGVVFAVQSQAFVAQGGFRRDPY